MNFFLIKKNKEILIYLLYYIKVIDVNICLIPIIYIEFNF